MTAILGFQQQIQCFPALGHYVLAVGHLIQQYNPLLTFHPDMKKKIRVFIGIFNKK